MLRPHQIVAYTIPILVLAVVAGVALHDNPQSVRAAASGPVAPITRRTHAAITTPTTVTTPKGEPVFSATFTGKRLDTSVWSTCYPEFTGVMGAKGGCRNFGNPEEAEWYLPSQDKVYGGVLHLVAQRVATEGTASLNGKPKEYDCRSGMITSYPSLKFKYGFIQVVARIPHAPALWPALWLAAANQAYPPEIDMIESWGVNQLTASYLHPLPVGTPRDRGLIPVSSTTGWQTYSLSWTRSKLTYYTGNKVILTVTKNVPHQAMFFLANVAEYLPPHGGDCNGQMLIRSVRIWKN
jgi:beta-glucanase (GH16 family)